MKLKKVTSNDIVWFVLGWIIGIAMSIAVGII